MSKLIVNSGKEVTVAGKVYAPGEMVTIENDERALRVSDSGAADFVAEGSVSVFPADEMKEFEDLEDPAGGIFMPVDPESC